MIVTSEESKVALRIAHLSMIQGVITRMSGFSASAKTFTITILAGLAAISLQADAMQLGVIAMIAAVILFLIDTYYMTLEVRFRSLYDEVVARHLDLAVDMSIAPVVKSGDKTKAINSKSNWMFYGPVLLACVLFIGYGYVHDRQSKRLPRTDTARVEQSADARPTAATKRPERPVQPAASTQGAAGRRISERPAATSTASPGQSLRNEA